MRLLLIGCGSIGMRHLRNLKAIDSRIELVAYDPNPQTLELAVQEGARGISEWDRVKDFSGEALLLCTPSGLHGQQIRELSALNIPMFVEKPLCTDEDEANSLLGVESILKIPILVGCNLRFHPPVLKIEEWLGQECVGDLLFLRVAFGNFLPNWRPGVDYRKTYSAVKKMGGGIIFDSIHEIDLADHWLGGARQLTCVADRIGALEIDVEDNAEIVFQGPNRRMAQIHLDYLTPRRYRSYELVGSKGMIQWSSCGKSPEVSSVGIFDLASQSWKIREEMAIELNEMYLGEMRHFLRVVAGEESPCVSLQRGVRLVQLAHQCHRAAMISRTVKL